MKRFQRTLTTFVLAASLAGGVGLAAAAPAAAACGITSISNTNNGKPQGGFPNGIWTLKVNYTNCEGSAIRATLVLTNGTKMSTKVVSPYGGTSWTYHTPTKMGVNRVTYTLG
jgi:hypothetical protein